MIKSRLCDFVALWFH